MRSVKDCWSVCNNRRKHGKEGSKAAVLTEVLQCMKVVNREEAVLIGDTRYDAQGAAEVGIDCVGIRYGFEPDMDMMLQAGALCICDSIEEAIEYLV